MKEKKSQQNSISQIQETEDLIIVDARGSCGCTVPQYPKNTQQLLQEQQEKIQ